MFHPLSSEARCSTRSVLRASGPRNVPHTQDLIQTVFDSNFLDSNTFVSRFEPALFLIQGRQLHRVPCAVLLGVRCQVLRRDEPANATSRFKPPRSQPKNSPQKMLTRALCTTRTTVAIQVSTCACRCSWQLVSMALHVTVLVIAGGGPNYCGWQSLLLHGGACALRQAFLTLLNGSIAGTSHIVSYYSHGLGPSPCE